MAHVAFCSPKGASLWWLAVLWLLAGPAWAAGSGATAPAWQAWSPQVFEQARRESRLVLLDVVAEWCQLCKKMDLTTYRDLKVLEMIRHRYIPVRADVDRVAEIKQRYGAYGVPAVVIFDGEGTEIIRRRGYLPSEWLYWMLVAVADNPDPRAHR
jgi:thiol:disulfide interchange protein